MIFFITVLRALAACLITNSHYTGIYPTDLIANGGLLGDVIFFAVSGYCLINVKKTFPVWYGKRIWRVYLPLLIITSVYFLIGAYTFKDNDFLWWFVYPTNYHFVASIILLYIPFYFVGRCEWLKKRIPILIGVVFAVYLFVYFAFYDREYYHIDVVREPMIRFIFFESMLLGGYFKYNDEKFRNKFKWYELLIVAILFVGYFASKLIFSRKSELAPLQILNQILLFALLFYIFKVFTAIDEKLEKLPLMIKKVIEFIASITLEIYLVQNVIISAIRPYFGFPLNWLLITSSIVASAFVLHLSCKYIAKGVEKIIQKIVGAIHKKEEGKAA